MLLQRKGVGDRIGGGLGEVNRLGKGLSGRGGGGGVKSLTSSASLSMLPRFFFFFFSSSFFFLSFSGMTSSRKLRSCWENT